MCVRVFGGSYVAAVPDACRSDLILSCIEVGLVGDVCSFVCPDSLMSSVFYTNN